MAQSSMGDSAELLPLTKEEEKVYGALGERMEGFHNYFKYQFNEIYEMADGSFTKVGMPLVGFLSTIRTFKRHLENHHGIEESYLFPILAKKMPAFAENEQHRESHKKIHDGLDALGDIMKRVYADQTTYSPTELRACLDGFREPLLRHLDEEVNDLRAENMRKYWTIDEVRQIPI